MCTDVSKVSENSIVKMSLWNLHRLMLFTLLKPIEITYDR